MNIIRLQLKDNTILVETTNESIKLNKSQVKNVFYYTSKYINKNKEEINNLFKNKTTIYYKDENAFNKTYDFINKANLIFGYNYSLTSRVIEKLKGIETKKITCFFMPSDAVHYFANKNITIVFKNNLSFDSDFIKYNDFNSLKDIYYKKEINFYSKSEITNNLENFLKINKNIRIINLYYYNLDVLQFILKLLEKYEVTSIYLLIHKNLDNSNIINNDEKTLKKLNGKSLNEIKIVYDEEYLKEKLPKVIMFNSLKLSMLLILYAGFVIIATSLYYDYASSVEIRKLELEVATSSVVEVDEIDDTNIASEDTSQTIESIKKETNSDPFENISPNYDKLLEINSEVVGWVKVNNTKINYPVVKHTDNDYYLHHDIYNREYYTGWVFMDYRNNEKDLNQNTIIYAHTMTSGLMFGTLYYASLSEWNSNLNNQIIRFNTLYEEGKYRIFSVYKIEDTSDYLQNTFETNEEFMSFIDLIKSRSIYNYDVEVHETDKILTLSTCTGNHRRLVVHAVKVN